MLANVLCRWAFPNGVRRAFMALVFSCLAAGVPQQAEAVIVTPSAGPNGTIFPDTPQDIAPGASGVFTVTPDFKYISGPVGGTCGGSVVGNTLTTDPVVAPCAVVATFVQNQFSVIPIVGPNGTVVPDVEQILAAGAVAVFTITPDPLFIASVTSTCGGSFVGPNTYQTNVPTADCTVTVSFVQNQFVVTPSAGPNGTIFPDVPQTLAIGAVGVFTVTPDPGFAASVGGTCGGTLVGTTFTTPIPTANCTVIATFTPTTVRTYTAPSATGSGIISATFAGGGPTCTYTRSSYIPVSGAAGSPPAGTAPEGVVFPHGLFDFAVGGCTAGSTITMTITYPSSLPPGTQYWKYGPTPGDPAPHWYVLPATIAGNTATFTITDGALGDDDLAANGAIDDQGGPGATAASIPTMAPWMLIAMGLLVLGSGLALRRV